VPAVVPVFVILWNFTSKVNDDDDDLTFAVRVEEVVVCDAGAGHCSVVSATRPGATHPASFASCCSWKPVHSRTTAVVDARSLTLSEVNDACYRYAIILVRIWLR